MNLISHISHLKSIYEKENVWGSKLLENLSNDLKREFPEMSGFSVRNLKYFKFFYKFYKDSFGQQVVAQIEDNEIRQQSVAQIQDSELYNLLLNIPWGHHIVIFTKINNQKLAYFYIQQTIENK